MKEATGDRIRQMTGLVAFQSSVQSVPHLSDHLVCPSDKTKGASAAALSRASMSSSLVAVLMNDSTGSDGLLLA